MELTQVPQIDGTNPNPTPDAAAMALTGNTMQDLQNVAREMGVSLDRDGNVVEAPAQPSPVSQPAPVPQHVESAPAQPQAAEQPATQPVQVPQKFQNPDGTPNVEKIVKSTLSADEAIAKYRAKEKELSQIQNRVNNPPPQPVQPQPQQGVYLSDLERGVASDLMREAAALGSPISEGQAVAQARVMARLAEAKYTAELNATADLRTKVEDYQRTLELKEMLDKDPALLSGEMADALWKVRQDNPWLNNAPEPWKAAYHYYRGQYGHATQVQTPTPMGPTVKAPPTPVGPVTRVQRTVDVTNPKSLSDADLVAEIRKIHPNFRNI